jgi:hypothetical protein
MMSQNSNFREIISYAIKAPSGHNTQPWKFKILDKAIEVYPNFDHSLPVVDSSNRELYISLGCAVENLCIAAEVKGYLAVPSICKTNNNTYYIHIEMTPQAPAFNSLFESIDKRQTNRSIYSYKPISPDTLKVIRYMPDETGVHHFVYINGDTVYRSLSDYIYQGNTIQMSDKLFKNELLSWIRFNPRQVKKTMNGLSYKVMGSPSTPSFMGKMLVRCFLKPGKQNAADKQKLESSSCFVLFTTSHNTPEEWIMAGRSLERMLLKTTSLNMANGFMNQPCEIPELAARMQAQLPINHEHPTILIRLGYAQSMPYSPRKSVEEVIMQ